MQKVFKISGILNAISLIVLILFLGVQLSGFGMWFYRWQYSANNTYEVLNMEPQDLHEVTAHMIRYMQGREPDLQIMTTVGGETRYFFSEIEIRHMIDVYELFSAGLFIQNILIALFLSTLALFLIKGKAFFPHLLKCWKIGSIATLLALLSLVVIISINWHHAFVVFHEIFFDNDYWILDPRVDLLINAVPYPFFISISVFIGGFFAAGLALIFVLSALGLRRIKRTQKKIMSPP